MKCIEVRAVRRPEIWKFIPVSYIIAPSNWRQRIPVMHRKSRWTELAEKKTTGRIYPK